MKPMTAKRNYLPTSLTERRYRKLTIYLCTGLPYDFGLDNFELAEYERVALGFVDGKEVIFTFDEELSFQ